MTTTNKTPINTPMTAAIMPTPVWGLSSVFPKMSTVGVKWESAVVIGSVIGGKCESEVVTVSVSDGGRRTGSLIKKKLIKDFACNHWM